MMIEKAISVILPVYNEQENIEKLYKRLCSLSENNTDKNFEFIFVDDASMDDTFGIIRELTKADNRIKIIRFSKNFGTHAACLAGLVHSTGDAATFLYADLQEPPELFQELIEKWDDGIDVVIGVREWENSSKRFFPNIYYSLVRRFALSNMPAGGADVFLIDRKVIDAVVRFREKNTSIFGLILWSGFSQALVTYKKRQRECGVSKWTLGKKIKLFVDTFVAFSYFPIRMISIIGILFAVLGFIYAVFIVFNRLFFAAPLEGWASLMVVLLAVSGVQLMMLGILGEYLWRNFDESRNRPPFIIKSMIGYGVPSRKGREGTD
jgi:glycosyltransferase involved in cell wall biosynthesis